MQPELLDSEPHVMGSGTKTVSLCVNYVAFGIHRNTK